jgi:hypothetical protein
VIGHVVVDVERLDDKSSLRSPPGTAKASETSGDDCTLSRY